MDYIIDKITNKTNRTNRKKKQTDSAKYQRS